MAYHVQSASSRQLVGLLWYERDLVGLDARRDFHHLPRGRHFDIELSGDDL